MKKAHFKNLKMTWSLVKVHGLYVSMMKAERVTDWSWAPSCGGAVTSVFDNNNHQCVGCHASCIIIFSWQCKTGIVIETTSLETKPWKRTIHHLSARSMSPPPTVFPQWECLWDGLWWRHLQAVWSACRPGADDVQPRQHYLWHHLRGVLQERPPAPGRLWWLQLQRLGHAEGRACRWVTPELWLWVLYYWQMSRTYSAPVNSLCSWRRPCDFLTIGGVCQLMTCTSVNLAACANTAFQISYCSTAGSDWSH